MDPTGILLCLLGALFMRFGLALYLGGVVRAKNAAGMILRVAADFIFVTLAFWALGMAVGQRGFHPSLLLGGPGADQPDSLRLLIVSLMASGIVLGTVSERIKFFSAIWASVLMGGLLVPLASRLVWHGWLAQKGYHDFAGASVVHLTGAITAAVGAIFVGPRMGKYNRDGSANVLPGHNVLMACSGVMAMLVAWVPYVLSFSNPTQFMAFGHIAMNVLIAGAGAGAASLIYGQLRFGKADIYLTFSGLMGGLVAISASADLMSNRLALLVGIIAGILVPWATLQIDLIWRIDDPSAAIATHGVGGIWGILAAALLMPSGSVGYHLKMLGVQVLGCVIIAAAAVVLSVTVFWVVKKTVGLRSREADEFDGLDLAEHDIGAYPDFQQTTIKSYHLREA